MPATTIYYFSATGNSLVVARTTAEKLGDTKLVHMAHPDAANPSPNTPRVGLVFPVYIFGLPLIVTRLIEKLQVPAGAYLPLLVSRSGNSVREEHGGTYPLSPSGCESKGHCHTRGFELRNE